MSGRRIVGGCGRWGWGLRGRLVAGLVRAAGVCVAWGMVLASASPAWSQAVGGVKALEVSAMPEHQPALDIRLLPPFETLISGNGAPSYLAAFSLISAGATPEVAGELDAVLSAGIAEIRAQLRRDPGAFEGTRFRAGSVVEGALAVAARYRRCEWDWDLRQGFDLLLPHLGEARRAARAAAALARVRIAEGRYDEAFGVLQTGFALGRDIGRGQTLIEGLAGMAITAVMLDQVEALIAEEGAPNMYWALADLDGRLVSIREALDLERSLIWANTGLSELPTGELADRWTEAQWTAYAQRLASSFLSFVAGGDVSLTDGLPVQLAAGAVIQYPRAKAALMARGVSEAEVDAMPVARVVVEYTAREFRYYQGELFKWTVLPYRQAREGLERTEALFERAASRGEGWPATVMLPALVRPIRTHNTMERRVAALRLIEAMRDAASESPVRPGMPVRLPVPVDPGTGRPYEYSIDGGVVRIRAERFGDPSRIDGTEFDIGFRGDRARTGQKENG